MFFFSVLFVFTVAWIHHQSYFGITTRILHTHARARTRTHTQTNKPSASGTDEAKCVPQRFSNIKNISWIWKPVKCRHQTLRCISCGVFSNLCCCGVPNAFYHDCCFRLGRFPMIMLAFSVASANAGCDCYLPIRFNLLHSAVVQIPSCKPHRIMTIKITTVSGRINRDVILQRRCWKWCHRKRRNAVY